MCQSFGAGLVAYRGFSEVFNREQLPVVAENDAKKNEELRAIKLKQ